MALLYLITCIAHILLRVIFTSVL